MVPRLSKPGRTFHYPHLYFSRDKDTDTSERVGWTHVLNVRSNDPDKAVQWMIASHYAANAAKDEHNETGRRIEKPVFTWSLALHPSQGDPGQEYWLKAAKSFLAEFGLENHPTVLYSHTDQEYSHIHGMSSLIDPQTQRMNTDKLLYKSQLKASRWAQRWEETEGPIFCEQRRKNNERRDNGESVKYRDPELEIRPLITKLYHQSKTGAEFRTALEQAGFKLAQGRRIVLIDPDGNLHSISRQIEKAKAADIRAKLAGLELPTVEQVRTDHREREQTPEEPQDTRQQQQEPESFDRDQYETDRQKAIVDAAIEAEQIRQQETKKQQRPRQQEEKAPSLPHKPAVRPAKVPGQSPTPPQPKIATASQINAQQDAHIQELADFREKTMRKRLTLESSLEEQYGENARTLQSEIAELQNVLENSGRWKIWFLKLTGRLSRTAEQDLEEKRRSLQNIEWRQQEAKSGFENQAKVQEAAIRQRQEQERRKLHPSLPQPSNQNRPVQQFERQAAPVHPSIQPAQPDRSAQIPETAPAIRESEPTKNGPDTPTPEPNQGKDRPDHDAQVAALMEHMERMQQRRRDRGPSRSRG